MNRMGSISCSHDKLAAERRHVTKGEDGVTIECRGSISSIGCPGVSVRANFQTN